MTRRTPAEIAAALDARSAKLKEESERRRAVASDPACELMYDAEKVLLKLAWYTSPAERDTAYWVMAKKLQDDREARWADLKAKGLA